MSRAVCQFSCGAASAVATKLTIAKYGHDRVLIVNAFVLEEHADNRRFLEDCQIWFGQSIRIVANQKFDASTDKVWLQKRYMKGLRGAPCSKLLKRDLLDSVLRPDDVVILGYTTEEEHRFEEWKKANPSRMAEAPLIEKNVTKGDALAMVDRAGLVLPMMYRLGFDNANCIGCPKGGQNYWQHIRHHFPVRFIQISNIQQNIGPGAYFLRFRSGPRKNERMSLVELPEGLGNMADEPSFSCSFYCEMAEAQFA